MSVTKLMPRKEEKMKEIIQTSESAMRSLILGRSHSKSSNITSKLLIDMERKGEIKLGSGRLSKNFWTMPKPYDPEGLVRQALIADRNRDL